MGCRVFRYEKNGEIKKVVAPNGQPSKLYQQLFSITGDKESALQY